MEIQISKNQLQLTLLPTLFSLWLLSLLFTYQPLYGSPTFSSEDPNFKLAIFITLTIITSTAYFIAGFYRLISNKNEN